MKKKLTFFVAITALTLSLSGCGAGVPSNEPADVSTPQTAVEAENTEQVAPPESTETQDSETGAETQAPEAMTAYFADGSAVLLADCGDRTTWKDTDGQLYYLGADGVLRTSSGEELYTEVPPSPESKKTRQDGERFEEVIVIEGMDETVYYEHIRNESLGFEMDYDYERFTRYSDADCERFVSVWDIQDSPENYLEVTYSQDDAETVAAAVSETLSKDYEIIRGSTTLEGTGNCIRVGASEVKGGGYTSDYMQMVYIIPAPDGCRVATAHYAAEGADGFGRRFSHMVNTLTLIDRNSNGVISDEQALAAIQNYCYSVNPDLEDMVKAEEYPIYWEIVSSEENEVVVMYRSYTGAQNLYYIDRSTGDTYETEIVPMISPDETQTGENFNVKDYL